MAHSERFKEKKANASVFKKLRVLNIRDTYFNGEPIFKSGLIHAGEQSLLFLKHVER
jgi:hypothetical protein